MNYFTSLLGVLLIQVSCYALPIYNQLDTTAPLRAIVCQKASNKLKIDGSTIEKKESIKLNRETYRFVAWGDLDGTKDDLILREPDAVGSSLEDYYTFLLHCDEDEYAVVLKEYAHSYAFIGGASQQKIVLTSRFKKELDDVSVEIKHRVYAVDGSDFKPTESNLLEVEDDFIIEATAAIEAHQTTKKLGFKPSLWKEKIIEGGQKITITLANGNLLHLLSFHPKTLEEGQKHYQFVQHYEALGYLLLKQTSWEEHNYLLINLTDGQQYELEGMPCFSKDKKQFCTAGQLLDYPEIKRRVRIYQINGTTIKKVKTILLKGVRNFIFQPLFWNDKNSIIGNYQWLNEQLEEEIVPAVLWYNVK